MKRRRSPTASGPAMVRARVELSILGAPLHHEFVVPAGPTRPIRMLPVLQSFTDAIVKRSIQAAEAEGGTISCRAGCGACCRQIVPISETEARHLAALVDAAPAPRREALRARFAEVRRRLEAAGLWKPILGLAALSDDEIERLGLEYFRAGVPCPFLEEESCSIHPDRPLSCREFLVTSPAENCEAPTPETILPVDIPSHASDALARLDPGSVSRSVYWLPLVIALEWAAAHPDDRPARRGTELLDEFLGLFAALGEPDEPPQDAR